MAKQNLNNLKEESVGILSTLNDISKLIAQNADKLSKATGDSASTFRESFSASKKLADELLKLDEETLANAKERQKLEGQFRAVNSEINKLTANPGLMLFGLMYVFVPCTNCSVKKLPEVKLSDAVLDAIDNAVTFPKTEPVILKV
jgi:uncharacterized phage infection (PIP) family protein YhgE